MPQAWKVGALAQRTGISIRTLHYYDEIGLLSPSLHSEAGYRLYTARDVARLHKILALRDLGCSLEEIRLSLADPSRHLGAILRQQLARLEEQLAQQRRLHETLCALLPRLDAPEEDAAEELLDAMALTNTVARYYSPGAWESLRAHRDALGEEAIRASQAAWGQLLAEVRAAMEAQLDPSCDEVRALAARWDALIQSFTGGDPAREEALRAMYQHEPHLAGHDTAALRHLLEYLRRGSPASSRL